MLTFNPVPSNGPDLSPRALVALDLGGPLPVLALAGRVHWIDPERRPLGYVPLGFVADQAAAELPDFDVL
jgi:hypothetical protein